MEGPLAGAIAKVDRAQEHFRTLYKQIERWSKQGAGSVTMEKEPDLDPTVFRHFSEFSPVPDVRCWALLVGDTVHNLRTALDHAVYECSGPGERPTGIEYPIIVDRATNLALPKSDRRSYCYKIRGIRNRHVRAIIKRTQPWGRPDSPELHKFWLLHQLDIQDKHHLLTPVAGIPIESRHKISVKYFDTGRHLTHVSGPEWVPFDQKAEFLTVETDVSPKSVDVNLTVHFWVGLSVGGTIRPLQSTLRELIRHTRRVVEQIRDAVVEAEQPPPA